eukprot:3540515-Rhodomonas_salina.2
MLRTGLGTETSDGCFESQLKRRVRLQAIKNNLLITSAEAEDKEPKEEEERDEEGAKNVDPEDEEVSCFRSYESPRPSRCGGTFYCLGLSPRPQAIS